jgi:hypothetical protein
MDRILAVTITPTPTTHVTLDLLAWRENGTLELSPKFQRRPVWKAASRSYFIDTLLRGYPVPPIHVRLGMSKGSAVREIIDGQQRLRAVFDYVQGKYRLSRSLDATWAGKAFKDLDLQERERLMMYKFHGFQYESIDDSTVLEIFARINTYSVALSKQELRNGKFFGQFKTAMYDSARDHLEFWRSSGIFTETAIARMLEVELVSELSIMLLDGLQDKKATIDSFYSGLDEQWGDEPQTWVVKRVLRPQQYLSREVTAQRLANVIDHVAEAVGDQLPTTEFKRVPLFYSLFGAVAHKLYGIPRVNLATTTSELTENDVISLRETVSLLSELLSDKPSPDDLIGWQRDFVIAASRQTDNLAPRQTRLETIWNKAALGH